MKTELYRRYYQPDVLRWMITTIHEHAESAILLPTGSGKTTVILAYIAWNFSLRDPLFNQIFVVAPQKAIRDGFRPQGGLRRYQIEEHGPLYSLPESMPLEGAKDLDLLIQDPAERPEWFTGTHQIFSGQVKKNFPKWIARQDDLKGKLLIVDEGHHAHGDTALREFLEYWLAKGGSVLYATATPKDILRDGVVSYQIPLVELMERRFAPRTILSSFIDTGLKVDEEAERTEFAPRVESDAELHQAFTKMVEAWEAEGRPKMILRVKPTKGAAANVRLLAYAKEAFKDAGARVLAVRDPESIPEGIDSREFCDSEGLSIELGKERTLASYADSKWDVIVAMNTMIEGADWPLCSHVFLMGLPDSFLTITQILGRATRQRTGIKGYPAAWVNTSRIVFFVGGIKEEGHMKAHGRPMLLIGCALTSYTVGSQWSSFREDVRLVEDFPQIQREVRSLAALTEAQENRVNEALLELVESFRQDCDPESLQRLGGTAGSFMPKRHRHRLMAKLKDLPSELERQALKSRLNEQYPQIKMLYTTSMRARLTKDTTGAQFLAIRAEILDELLDKFLDLTMVGTPGLLKDLEAQGTLRLTAPVLKEMTAELIARCPPQLYRNNVLRQVLAYIKGHPSLPYEDFLKQKDPESFDGDTFGDYHRAATLGQRGLEKYADGIRGLVCASKYDKKWADLPGFESLIADHLQYKTPWTDLLTGLMGRYHSLVYFYGNELVKVLRKLDHEVCRRLDLEDVSRICRWSTQAEYDRFKDLAQSMAVKEAINGVEKTQLPKTA